MIDGCNRNDIVVVMGNFKAKVGGDHERYELHRETWDVRQE